jgi:hypothetical protein
MEFFTKINTSVVSHPLYFFLFLRLKIKLKGRHFDTTEVIEAELQAALNTLTEHDCQDAFKIQKKLWEQRIRAKGTISEGTVASRSKISL